LPVNGAGRIAVHDEIQAEKAGLAQPRRRSAVVVVTRLI